MNPDFLNVDDVLVIHGVQIERFGGDDGVRDPGLVHQRRSFGNQYRGSLWLLWYWCFSQHLQVYNPRLAACLNMQLAIFESDVGV